MKIFVPVTAIAAMFAANAAMAQVTTPSTMPDAPSATVQKSPTSTMTLTEAEAKGWAGKAIYSSDNTKIGTVGSFQRDTSGTVTGLNADIGSFLGIGGTSVLLKPEQFTLNGDRVNVSMTADQAKSLPKAK